MRCTFRYLFIGHLTNLILLNNISMRCTFRYFSFSVSIPRRLTVLALVVPSPGPCRALAASPRDPPTRPRPVDSSATHRPARWV
jgi:hypothetical protein